MRADRLTQNLARGCTRQPPGGGPGRSFDGAVEQPPACRPMRVVALPQHSLSSIDVAAHAAGAEPAVRTQLRWRESKPLVAVWNCWYKALTCGDASDVSASERTVGPPR